MAVYQNISGAVKKFYGVTFAPGEIHQVFGCINDAKMIRLPDTADVIKHKQPAIKKVKATKEIPANDAGGNIDG